MSTIDASGISLVTPYVPSQIQAERQESDKSINQDMMYDGPAVSVELSETAQAQTNTISPTSSSAKLESQAIPKPVAQTQFDIGVTAVNKANEIPASIMSLLETTNGSVLKY